MSASLYCGPENDNEPRQEGNIGNLQDESIEEENESSSEDDNTEERRTSCCRTLGMFVKTMLSK